MISKLTNYLGLPESWAFLVAQMGQNLPAMRETWVRSLGWEDPLEEGMAIHVSILSWRILMDRGALWATVHGVAKTERLRTPSTQAIPRTWEFQC